LCVLQNANSDICQVKVLTEFSGLTEKGKTF